MGLRKLTKYDVQRIFERFATGNHTPEDIGQEFGVSGIYVGQLLRRGGRGDTNIDERLKTIGKQASKGCYARLDLAPQAEEPEDFFEQLKTALGLIDIDSMLIDDGLLIRHPEGIKKLVLANLFGGKETIMEKITEDEKIAREIEKLGGMNDPEEAHVQADRILVKILEKHGYHSTIAAFNLLRKYYS